jgi:hypothetical protein
MRRVFAASGVLALAMIGYAVSGISAQSSSTSLVATGDRLRLWYPGDGAGTKCTVASVRNDFIRCEPEQIDRFITTPTREEWLNLRTLRSFERLPNDR